jgi:hypothetical protein
MGPAALPSPAEQSTAADVRPASAQPKAHEPAAGVAGGTRARGAAASPWYDFTFALGYSYVAYETASYSLAYGAISGAVRAWLRPGVEISAGARAGFGNELVRGAFEPFGAVHVVPRFRSLAGETATWRPSLGIELGRTSARYDEPGSALPYPPDGIASLRAEQPSRMYGMITSSPFRVRAWKALDATVFGIGVGTGLDDPGKQVRIQLTLVEFGGVL